jgi:hypothetical protein
MLNVNMLSFVMLSVITLSVDMMSVIMPSVIMLSIVMLSIVMLSAVMLSVVMLSVVELSVLAPLFAIRITKLKNKCLGLVPASLSILELCNTSAYWAQSLDMKFMAPRHSVQRHSA